MTKDIALSNGKTIPAERFSQLKPRKSAQELLQGIKGQERVDKALVVLLDASGSMSEIVETGSKISVAWKVLKEELMPNMRGWAYGILKFQGWDEARWEVYPCQDTRALTVLSTPYAIGSTPMKAALTKAWQWVQSHAKQARFIVLSDGEPTDGKDDIIRLAQENSSIPIDTVGIGAGIYGYDREFLQKLSDITGGTFVEAGSVKLLSLQILKLSPAERPLLGTVKE